MDGIQSDQYLPYGLVYVALTVLQGQPLDHLSGRRSRATDTVGEGIWQNSSFGLARLTSTT
ncbi:hypothetical protein [Leptolyngbya iicbica]|uniref:hypothetical protein n=1 Tax=Leptolyngbya iicbica TaxID=3161580 RepID=UPI0013EE8FE7|nr:hypothetical protein [Leptolyngbya sp. LK]